MLPPAAAVPRIEASSRAPLEECGDLFAPLVELEQRLPSFVLTFQWQGVPVVERGVGKLPWGSEQGWPTRSTAPPPLARPSHPCPRKTTAQHSADVAVVGDLAHVGPYEELWLLRPWPYQPIDPAQDNLDSFKARPDGVWPAGHLALPRPGATRHGRGAAEGLLNGSSTLCPRSRRVRHDWWPQHEQQHDETMLAHCIWLRPIPTGRRRPRRRRCRLPMSSFPGQFLMVTERAVRLRQRAPPMPRVAPVGIDTPRDTAVLAFVEPAATTTPALDGGGVGHRCAEARRGPQSGPEWRGTCPVASTASSRLPPKEPSSTLLYDATPTPLSPARLHRAECEKAAQARRAPMPNGSAPLRPFTGRRLSYGASRTAPSRCWASVGVDQLRRHRLPRSSRSRT